MPARKLKINKIDIDSLEKDPVIIIDKSTDYSLEFISETIIDQVSITDLGGTVIYLSDISGKKFVFTYHAGCKDMFLLKIKMHNQRDESQMLIL
jgi:hypothetical protein